MLAAVLGPRCLDLKMSSFVFDPALAWRGCDFPTGLGRLSLHAEGGLGEAAVLGGKAGLGAGGCRQQ